MPLGIEGAELIYARTLPVSENSSNSTQVYAVPRPFEEVSEILSAASTQWADLQQSEFKPDLAYTRRANGSMLLVQPGRLVREPETVKSEEVVIKYGTGEGFCMVTVAMPSSGWRYKLGRFFERFRSKQRLYQYQIIRDGIANPVSFEYP